MSTPSPATGYVLAGGLSRRLGRDKTLLPWQKGTLLDHMKQLLGTVCSPVQVVGRDGLPDSVPGLGPLGGISTALHDSRSADNFVVAVDLPLLTSDFMKYFKERYDGTQRQLTVCNIESAFPLCFGIRTPFVDNVDRYIATGQRSLYGLIVGSDPEVISAQDLMDAGFSARMFANINTETDYQDALRTITRDNP